MGCYSQLTREGENQGLVTIAIPAYKSAYLSEAIRSALEQDYSKIELIVIDDCSPDNIKEVVDSFKDSRVRYVRNHKNLGSISVVHNWNKCLDESRGEFFILLCDDDILLPNMVGSMLSLAERYPECGMFHAKRLVLKKSMEQCMDTDWPQEESFVEFVDNKFAGRRMHTITEFFYRTDFIRKEKYSVYPVGFYADDVTILKLCMRQGKMISSSESLVVFRESDIHITGNDKYIEGKIRAFVQYYQFLQTTPYLKDRISQEGYECILSQYLTHCDKKTLIKLLTLLPKSSTMLKTITYHLLKRQA